MQEIDLGEETRFKVTFRGNVYELREPTVAEVESFKDAGEQDGPAMVTKFLATIGMPEDVMKSMPMSQAKRLIDGLMEGLAKKK